MMKPLTENLQEETVFDKFLCSTGLWINGEVRWFMDTSYQWEQIEVKTTVEDSPSNIRLTSIELTNHDSHDKMIKLLSKHQIKTEVDHMTFVSPADHVLLHFVHHKVILFNGFSYGDDMKQNTTQSVSNINKENYWSCRKKGILKYQPMARGIAGSVCCLNVNLQGNSTVRLYTWMIEGETKKEVLQLDLSLLKNRLAFPVER